MGLKGMGLFLQPGQVGLLWIDPLGRCQEGMG
jgi:hypothetical protein